MRTALEPPTVAKKQVNAWMDESLLRLLQEAPGTTGATMTRIVSAALLQHIFSYPHGPAMRWMRAAIAVEQGEISVGEVPLWIARAERDSLGAQIKRLTEEVEEGKRDKRLLESEAFKELRRQYLNAQHEEFVWGNIAKLDDDGTEALLEFWKRSKAGLLELTPHHPEDGVTRYALSNRGWEPKASATESDASAKKKK